MYTGEKNKKKILSLILGLLVFTGLQAFADGKQEAMDFLITM